VTAYHDRQSSREPSPHLSGPFDVAGPPPTDEVETKHAALDVSSETPPSPPGGSPTVGPATFHVKHRALSSLHQTGGPVLRPQTPPTQAHRSRSRHPQLPPPKDDANIPSHLERHPRPRPPHRRKQQEELLCTQMESPHHPRHSTHIVPHSTHPSNSPAHVLPAHIPSIAHHFPVLTRTPPRPRRRVPHGHPPPRARPPTQ